MQRLDDKTKRIVAIILMFVFFLGGSGLSKYVIEKREAAAEDEYPMSRDVYLLDTYCQLTVYEGGGKEALEAAVDALNRYDDIMNYSKEGSDIYNINHRDSDTVSIDPDTAEMLRMSRELCVETEGVLEASKIEEALTRIKSLKWYIEGDTFTAEDPDVLIDVGAVAKGFIADKVKTVMKENGVSSGIINLGGNVLCIGERPDNTAFTVAVKDPQNESGYSNVLELNDLSAVTAGAYERCFEENGVRYHHIIDPKTGYSAQTGLESVTVVGPVSAICDGLSTSLFIMGEDKGKEFIEQYNVEHKTDYAAYFLKEEAEQN